MKILVVVRTLKKGVGISEWVISYYNKIADFSDVEIDILSENQIDSVESLGINRKINVSSIHKINGIDLLSYEDFWRKNAKKISNNYSAVHFHTDNFVRFIPYFYLRDCENVIVHSHNSYHFEVQNSHIKKLLHNIGKMIVSKSPFKRFACSDLAAKWLFGDCPYIQVNNGINLKDFEFSNTTREAYLKLFNLQDRVVFGHIGRFHQQKNHDKLIDIFFEVQKRIENSVLILCGDGPLEKSIKEKVALLKIEDKVIFLGLRDDIRKILNCFDFMIFPSLYEGLPLALVEAQANGIPVFYSDTITKDIELLPATKAFSITASDVEISNLIITSKKNDNREASVEILKSEKYDMDDTVDFIYKFYSAM